MKRYPKLTGAISLNECSWAQNLFKSVTFKRGTATISKFEIPEGAKKEAELLFLHLIVQKTKKISIPEFLIMNFEQTPSKFVPVLSSTLAECNIRQVVIKGIDDKQAKTGTFAFTLDDQFLGMQLIYGGKTTQSLPRYEFLVEFSLNVNQKHYGNQKVLIKFVA